MGNGWIQIVSKFDSFYAIKNDHTLWGWGSNYQQWLGTGNENPNENVPVQIGTDLWDRIYGGNGHCFAYSTDGSFYGWGNNYQDQIGVSSFPNSVTSPAFIGTCMLGTEHFGNENSFIIFPNPVIDVLTLKNNGGIIVDRISINDMLGKKIWEFHGNISEIDVSGLASGVYIINIFSQGKTMFHKFVKQ